MTQMTIKRWQLQWVWHKSLTNNKNGLRISTVVTSCSPLGMGGGGQMNINRFPRTVPPTLLKICKGPLAFAVDLWACDTVEATAEQL